MKTHKSLPDLYTTPEDCDEDVFDAKVHLAYRAPQKTFTLSDLGLSQDDNSTAIAGTEPFPLLSPEGVMAYRRAIMHPHVIEQCGRSFGKDTLILRNVAKCSKFVADFWSHPETNSIVSQALGVPVEVIMRSEMGHTNIQIDGDGDIASQLRVEPIDTTKPLTAEECDYDPLKGDSVIPWHYDSYPYVCIIMLSDTRNMVGGHTYIRTGDGSAHKVEGPSMGTAVVLQGGQVEHLAARAFGSTERITTISSYRVAAKGKWDNSFISNPRPYDCLDELYHNWSLYRLRKMREEIEGLEDQLLRTGSGLERFPRSTVEGLCERLSRYALRTSRQMVDPDLRDDVVARFGQSGVNKANRYWQTIRALPESAVHIDRAICWTKQNMPAMRKYFVDCSQTQAQLAMGMSVSSQHGPLVWDRRESYCVADELARQGLKETLLDWLDRTGLLRLVE